MSKIEAAFLAACILTAPAAAQVMQWTPAELAKYTAQWKGERFPDGRPKAPDALLEKVKGLSAEEVISIARRGFPSQFADGLHILNPGKNMVGRAVTLQLMPARQDVSEVVQADWRAKGRGPGINHQTAIDMLQQGDVLVIDAFGSLAAGGIIGDNLAYYIWKKTGTGFVIDGAIRDIAGVAQFGMPGYYRWATPPAIQGTMVMGINTPVRVGNTTVMPGDVVLGDAEGVFFIPPQLVQEVVDAADVTHVHDEWTKKKFDEGKYVSTDIYGRPRDPALIKEYEEYLKQKLGEEGYAKYLKEQQGSAGAAGGGRGTPPRR